MAKYNRPYNAMLKPTARKLRREGTQPEKHLWYSFLREMSPRFTRQRIVGNYILDFYCAKAKLAIELDGRPHENEENSESDTNREAFLNSLGIDVLRFTNYRINNDFAQVCKEIEKTITQRIISETSTNEK